MAHITTGLTFGVTRNEALIGRAIFDGKSAEDIAKLFFKVRDINGVVDPSKMATAKRKISALKRKPQFQEFYAALVREAAFDGFGKAQRKLETQIDNGNDWLANKAANDYLTRFSPYVMGDNSNEVTVRIEGLPTLGAPAPETDDSADADDATNADVNPYSEE